MTLVPGTRLGPYEIETGGQRLLLLMLDREAAAGTLGAILNWTSLLRKD